MPKRNPFPPEPATQPDLNGRRNQAARTSGPAPKGERPRSEAPTVPPPQAQAQPKRAAKSDTTKSGATKSDTARSDTRSDRGRTSGMQSRKKGEPLSPSATIDEVTADLSKDPRREE